MGRKLNPEYRERVLAPRKARRAAAQQWHDENSWKWASDEKEAEIHRLSTAGLDVLHIAIRLGLEERTVEYILRPKPTNEITWEDLTHNP